MEVCLSPTYIEYISTCTDVFVGMQLLVQDTATAESLGIADDTQLGEGDSGAWLGVCGRRRPCISTGSTSVSDSGSGSVETDAEGRLSFVQESFDEPCGTFTSFFHFC